ncbi:AB hydrolase superfamily protein [Colletotrichum siamense]|uniref:AB hydrolase superfamily protein n=1 Tax=Colletotrichum siamense TaxID=690259 RepID=A0A9P5ENM1_COLSI|nr:AB hydrolase superfamily protein [Colletotrichum siamense]KAF4855633.1 AB hydrolase superfamily protein [Colletotrichum siamense]
MLSVEETLALGTPSAEWDEAFKTSPPRVSGWTMDTDLGGLRAMMAQAGAAQRAAAPDPSTVPWVEEEIQIPTRDGASLIARIHKPKQLPEDGCPVFVAFHGGGFIIGSVEEISFVCRAFTQLGGIAVNVEYRLAPENPFPIPANDCYDAVSWTIENTKNLGINPEKGFLVGGESAGADLALGVAYLWGKEQRSPPLTGIYSSVAVAATEETVPAKYKDRFLSMEQNAHAPVITKESVQVIHKNYKPDFTSPVAYPILSPDLGNIMPKTYFQACGLDPLRDCTLVMEQVWRDAGVPTKLDLYPGVPHGFWAVYPHLKASQKFLEDGAVGLRWLLS